MDVPCRSCSACCESAYFIQIHPGERRTLEVIPGELLFPAPGLPSGHVVLGFDEKGRCPMFGPQGCSIYSRRPRTCRVYDCRIFAATGIPAGADKQLVGERAQRWQFDFTTPEDTGMYSAVRNAARFLEERAGLLPRGFVPVNTTQRAMLALSLHDVFYQEDAGGRSLEETAAAVIEAATVCRQAGAASVGE